MLDAFSQLALMSPFRSNEPASVPMIFSIARTKTAIDRKTGVILEG